MVLSFEDAVFSLAHLHALLLDVPKNLQFCFTPLDNTPCEQVEHACSAWGGRCFLLLVPSWLAAVNRILTAIEVAS